MVCADCMTPVALGTSHRLGAPCLPVLAAVGLRLARGPASQRAAWWGSMHTHVSSGDGSTSTSAQGASSYAARQPQQVWERRREPHPLVLRFRRGMQQAVLLAATAAARAVLCMARDWQRVHAERRRAAERELRAQVRPHVV